VPQVPRIWGLGRPRTSTVRLLFPNLRAGDVRRDRCAEFQHLYLLRDKPQYRASAAKPVREFLLPVRRVRDREWNVM
jgi:hypothetical protein